MTLGSPAGDATAPDAVDAAAPALRLLDAVVSERITLDAPPGGAPRDLPDLARTLFWALKSDDEMEARVLHGASLHVEAGEVVAVVGESGSGKSALARAASGYAPLLRGRLEIDGVSAWGLFGRRRKVVSRVHLLFDEPEAALDPRLSLRRTLSLAGGGRSDEDVAAMLARVGIAERFASRTPREVPPSLLQRTALARALLCAPRAIVVDEPVARVDLVDRTALLELLRDVAAASGIAVLVVTRDVAAATLVADRLAILMHGRVVEVGDKAAIAAAPLHPYARALMSAAPSLAPRRLARTVLNGLPPPSWRLPAGCPLHPRCPDATARCGRALPVLKLGTLDRPVACHVAHGEGDDTTAAG